LRRVDHWRTLPVLSREGVRRAIPAPALDDFKEFWKTQLFWGLVLAGLTTAWGVYRGSFSGSANDVVLPYVGMFAFFIVGNIGRTLFVRERRAVRKKRREEHRAEQRAYRESLRPPPKPPALAPKLRYERHYFSTVHFGDDLTGHSIDCLLVEVSNEHGDSVGDAKRIRGQLTYLDKNGKVLQRKCPVRWEKTYDEEIDIRKGEGESLAMAVCQGPWLSNLYDGIELKQCSRIEVRLLDAAGNEVTEMMPFAFGFKRDWDTAPFCTKL
jgi:hypothetical protein